MPLGDSSLTLLVSETSLGYSDQAERSRALGKEWKALVWLLNRVALVPFRRAKDAHWMRPEKPGELARLPVSG